jgi:hypothetical protein
MTGHKTPAAAQDAATRRAARIKLAVAKTETAIPAVRSAPTPPTGFRAPETGPTESLSTETATQNKRPKR